LTYSAILVAEPLWSGSCINNHSLASEGQNKGLNVQIVLHSSIPVSIVGSFTIPSTSSARFPVASGSSESLNAFRICSATFIC
jgi:hypothetical protein